MVIGPGCKPGLFFATTALLEPGDEVVCPDPGFPSYENMVKIAKAKLVPVKLTDGGTAIDMAMLAEVINPKTRVLILNSPSNPTGGVLDASVLDAIAELVAKHPRLWVFSDEIYARLVFEILR